MNLGPTRLRVSLVDHPQTIPVVQRHRRGRRAGGRRRLFDFIKFDLTEQPPQYYGLANTEGPFVDLTRSCPETDTVTSPTRAGGSWLTAPIDQNYAITDKNTIIGIFNNGAKLPIIHQWNIQRVE